MNRLLILTWLIVVSQTVRSATIPEIVAQAKPAVFQVVTFDQQDRPLKSGTGFFVSSNGYALTNFHVVSGATHIIGRINTGAIYFSESSPTRVDDLDIAILKFEATNVPFLRPGRSADAAEGEQILVIGTPEGLEGTVSEGIISAFRDNRRIIQITAPVSSGSSGSPVLNVNGKIIGVATVQYREGQNLNFAIAMDAIKDAVTQHQREEPSRTPPPEDRMEKPAAPDLNQFVKGFIEAGNADPRVEISYYADEVDYFDNGKVTKGFILDDITKYDKRWPRRAYHLSGDPEITVIDSGRDIAKAVFKFQFTIRNVQQTVWGSGENVLLIGNATTSPKVISVRSKILNKRVEPSGR